MRFLSLGLVLTVFFAAGACNAEDKDKKGDDKKNGDKKGTLVNIDGLTARTPPDWKEQDAAPPRYKHFTLPKVGDDKLDADVIIFYFRGAGGGLDENLKRWKDMFEPPAGKKLDDVAKVSEDKVGDVKFTRLDISGTYLFKARPMDAKAEPRPAHKMSAIYFASPKGPYFIRFVGPEKTYDAHKKGFDEWLKSFK